MNRGGAPADPGGAFQFEFPGFPLFPHTHRTAEEKRIARHGRIRSVRIGVSYGIQSQSWSTPTCAALGRPRLPRVPKLHDTGGRLSLHADVQIAIRTRHALLAECLQRLEYARPPGQILSFSYCKVPTVPRFYVNSMSKNFGVHSTTWAILTSSSMQSVCSLKSLLGLVISQSNQNRWPTRLCRSKSLFHPRPQVPHHHPSGRVLAYHSGRATSPE